MDVSLGLYPDAPTTDLIETVRQAERLRFATAWVADSHLLWREPYVLLGALAQATQHIRLATCVTNPLTRHPSVTASAFATLSELTLGRAVLGISVGDSALATLDQRPATRSELTRCVRQIRRLLGGRTIEPTAHANAQLSYRSAFPVPIYIAASAPRMLRLAGAIADGVILMNGVDPALLDAANALVDEGAVANERDPATIRRVVWAACHVSPDQPERSIAACKYNVARMILRDLPGTIDERTRAIAAQVRSHYDYAQHGRSDADFAHLIPDDLVTRFTFAGTPDAVTNTIHALAKHSVDEVALAIPHQCDAGDRDQVLMRVGERLSSQA